MITIKAYIQQLHNGNLKVIVAARLGTKGKGKGWTRMEFACARVIKAFVKAGTDHYGRHKNLGADPGGWMDLS